MNETKNVVNKDILKMNTTILFTSEFNYNKAAVELINDGWIVIDKNGNDNINEISNELLQEFDCEYLKERHELTKNDKIKISILTNLANQTSTFVFLNVLTYLENTFIKKLFNYLKIHNQKIINYTSEIEETLYLEYLIVIHNNEIIMEGSTKKILEEEEILKKLGFNLPFIIELSNGLKYYNIVEKLYFDNESLVHDLWN